MMVFTVYINFEWNIMIKIIVEWNVYLFCIKYTGKSWMMMMMMTTWITIDISVEQIAFSMRPFHQEIQTDRHVVEYEREKERL